MLPPGPLHAQSKVFGVTLTPAQQEHFKAINAAAEPAKKAVRENAALAPSEKQAQMKAIYDGIKEKLKAILTPDQLKEMEAATAAQRPGTLRNPTNAKVFGVTLTPAQQEQFKAFNAAAEPAKRAVRENTALTPAEKQAQMKTIYDGIKEKLKTILTPDQLKEMEAATAAPWAGTLRNPTHNKVFGVTLTPVQQEQFKAFNAAAEPAKKAVRENAALSPSEKQAQMKAIYDGIKEKLKAILTPDQLKEMDSAPGK